MLALGGAKNHLVALSDCEPESSASDIVASFAGCSGQRCMAASVLVLVGPNPALLEKILAKAAALAPGVEPGQVGHLRELSFSNESSLSAALNTITDRPTNQPTTTGGRRHRPGLEAAHPPLH